MSIPTIRYPLDETGLNVNNKITGEVHPLSANKIRAVAPKYGAFYTESLVVIDDLTQDILVRNTDYRCIELLQEASGIYGKEICYLIIIINEAVSPQVRINYQVLGGLYTRSADAIGKYYELIKDQDVPVNWVNVLNKPVEFNPAKHLHDLRDVYGFEYLVDSLERIRSAILLGSEPIFENFTDWTLNNIKNIPQADWDELNPGNDPNLKSFIRNKPQNLVLIGKLIGDGILRRKTDGTWDLKKTAGPIKGGPPPTAQSHGIEDGDLWWDKDDTGRLFIYDEGAWADASPSSAVPEIVKGIFD